MPAVDGTVLLVQSVAHLETVGDAMAVGDHQRRSGVGLRFSEGLQRLLPVGAHCHLGDIDIPVRDRLQRKVLARHRLSASGELGDRPQRGGLRHLPTGVRVHLGVEHQHVDVASAGQHVVQAAGTDVVGPAVAPDDPHAAAHQVVHDAAQLVRDGGIEPVEAAL